jgi:hypothetical protein
MTTKRPSPENMGQSLREALERSNYNRRWYGQAVLTALHGDGTDDKKEFENGKPLLDLSVVDTDAWKPRKDGQEAHISVMSMRLGKLEDILPRLDEHTKGRSSEFKIDLWRLNLLTGTFLALGSDHRDNEMVALFAHQVCDLVGGYDSSYSIGHNPDPGPPKTIA